MNKVIFDINKLNKTEQKIYLEMSDNDKLQFEKIWIQLETQKLRLTQQMNASKERSVRNKKALQEKERKERAHRLIERGALLESMIENISDFTTDDLKVILQRTLTCEHGKQVVDQIRNRVKISGNE